jgi:hypothetical protein
MDDDSIWIGVQQAVCCWFTSRLWNSVRKSPSFLTESDVHLSA